MPTFSARDLQTFPPNVGRDALERLLEETRSREVLVRETIRQFERRYRGLLEELEARLARGEGQEHPDWEDSIEWRNAVEALQRTQLLRSILEWLINSL
jgi:hypothetical protein